MGLINKDPALLFSCEMCPVTDTVYADVLLTAYWLVDSMGLCVIFRNTNNYLMMATIVWFLIDNLFQYKFNAFNNISVMEETGKTNQPSTWH